MDQNHPASTDHEHVSIHGDGESVLRACPAIDVLRLISGKWKPEILQLASQGKIRFNSLLRKIPGSNKQSLSVALRELEDADVLRKQVVSERPLHIEYTLTDRGLSIMPIFHVASAVATTPR
jgi:DNA-binding HxlR family transcriptional regulator